MFCYRRRAAHGSRRPASRARSAVDTPRAQLIVLFLYVMHRVSHFFVLAEASLLCLHFLAKSMRILSLLQMFNLNIARLTASFPLQYNTQLQTTLHS